MATMLGHLRSRLLIFQKPKNLPLFTPNRYQVRHRRPLSSTSRQHFPSQPQSSADHQLLPFHTGPSPPRLPKEEQEIFENLQRQSTGAFSTPREASPPNARREAAAPVRESRVSTPSELADAEGVISRLADQPPVAAAAAAAAASPFSSATESQPINPLPSPSPPGVDDNLDIRRAIEAHGTGSELHPNVRRGASPEFDGDVNPKTGEVGGPKNEPLRWGSGGEWTYNGRTTDF